MSTSDRLLLISLAAGVLWTLAWVLLRTLVAAGVVRWVQRTGRAHDVVWTGAMYYTIWLPPHAYALHETRYVHGSRWRWLALLKTVFTAPQR